MDTHIPSSQLQTSDSNPVIQKYKCLTDSHTAIKRLQQCTYNLHFNWNSFIIKIGRAIYNNLLKESEKLELCLKLKTDISELVLRFDSDVFACVVSLVHWTCTNQNISLKTRGQKQQTTLSTFSSPYWEIVRFTSFHSIS